jgi:hypothetical protein
VQQVLKDLKDSYSFSGFMSAWPISGQTPPLEASLVFKADRSGGFAGEFFQVLVISMDPVLGWQLTQTFTEERAPLSTVISSDAVLLNAKEIVWGKVNISNHADLNLE